MKFKLLIPDQSNYILARIVGVDSFQEVIDLSNISGLSFTRINTANGLKKQFEKGYFNEYGVTSLVCAIFSKHHKDPKEIQQRVAMLFDELDFSSGGIQAINWVNTLIQENMRLWRKGKEHRADWNFEMDGEGKIQMEERRPVVIGSDRAEEERTEQAEIILPAKPMTGGSPTAHPRPSRRMALYIALSILTLAVLVWVLTLVFGQEEPSPKETNQTLTEEQLEQPGTDPTQSPQGEPQEPAATNGTVEGNQINFGDNNQIENSTISGGDAHIEPKK